MYVVANYHYLHGLRFDEFDARLQLDTDPDGLLAPNPPERPLRSIGRRRRRASVWPSISASPSSSIAGTSAPVWAASRTGSSGRNITQHELALVSLFNGSEFVHVKLPRIDRTSRIELPVTYTGDVSYHRDAWSAYTEYSHGLEGNNFRAGLEYRFGAG